MAYKRFFYRNGNKFGPYYYESYRDKNGKVRKKYVGTIDPDKKLVTPTKKLFIFIFISAIVLILLGLSFFYFQNQTQISTEFKKVISGFSVSEPEEVQSSDVLAEESVSEEIVVEESSSDSVVEAISETSESSLEEISSETSLEENLATDEAGETETNEIQEGTEPTQTIESNETSDIEEIIEQLNQTEEIINETENIIDQTEEIEDINETINSEIPENNDVGGIVFNETNQTILPEINQSEIDLNETNLTEINQTIEELNQTVLNQTIINQTIIPSNNTLETNLIQYQAVINRPVKWIKTIEVNASENISELKVEVPVNAEEIIIRTDEEAEIALREIEEEEIQMRELEMQRFLDEMEISLGITGNAVYRISETQGILSRFFKWLLSFTISGKVVYEEDLTITNETTNNTKTIDLSEIVQTSDSMTLEYYTQAPNASETDIANGKRMIISAPDELNYTNILAYTGINASININNPTRIRVIWKASYEDAVKYGYISDNQIEVVNLTQIIEIPEELEGEIEEIVEENETIVSNNLTETNISESELNVSNQDININESVIEEEIISENETIIEENETELSEVNEEIILDTNETTSFITGAVVLDEENINESENETIDSMPEQTEKTYDIEVNFTAYDLDNNGNIDYVEWIVPHLSNQVYEIIYISNAEHLDENRSFISNIYEDVNTKDNNWSEPINNNEYARIVFERNLSYNNDITIYARAVNLTNLILNNNNLTEENINETNLIEEEINLTNQTSNNSFSQIEVYTKDSNEIIAVFDNVSEESWYKIYLTNLSANESYDSFDLRVVGDENLSAIEFDYIVDPTPGNTTLSAEVWDKEQDEEIQATSDDSRVYVNELTKFYVNLTGNNTMLNQSIGRFYRSNSFSIRSADINNDGIENEIALGTYNYVYGYYPNGTVKWTYTDTAATYFWNTELADVNNDSIKEIITSDNGGFLHIINVTSGALLMKSGDFGSCYALAVGDVNDDNVSDIAIGCNNVQGGHGVVVYAYNSETLSYENIWNATGYGGIIYEIDISEIYGQNNLVGVVDYTGGRAYIYDGTGTKIWNITNDLGSTYSIEFFDQDSDGKEDEFLFSEDGEVRGFSETGETIFNKTEPVSGEYEVKKIDLDKDGIYDDFIVGSYYLGLYLYDSAGTLNNTIYINSSIREAMYEDASNIYIYQLLVSDLENDGVDEIIVAGYQPAVYVFDIYGNLKTRFWYGDNPGSNAGDYVGYPYYGKNPGLAVIDDVSGDGIKDILSVRSSGYFNVFQTAKCEINIDGKVHQMISNYSTGLWEYNYYFNDSQMDKSIVDSKTFNWSVNCSKDGYNSTYVNSKNVSVYLKNSSLDSFDQEDDGENKAGWLTESSVSIDTQTYFFANYSDLEVNNSVSEIGADLVWGGDFSAGVSYDVEPIDYDGDGKEESLAYASSNYVYLYDVNGNLITSRYDSTYGAIFVIGSGDINNDSNEDVVALSYNGYVVILNKTVSQEVFQSPDFGYCYSLAVGDLTGDGVDDIAAGCSSVNGGHGVVVFSYNFSSGNYDNIWNASGKATGVVRNVLISEISGQQGLLAFTDYDGQEKAYVYYGNGTSAWDTADLGSYSGAVQFVDLNDDGIEQEIVVDSFYEIYGYNASGQMWTNANPASVDYDMAKIDYDGDGKRQEVVVFESYTIRIYDRLGTQIFASSSGTYDYPRESSIAGFVADINNDGEDEIVFGGSGGVIYVLNRTGALQYYYDKIWDFYDAYNELVKFDSSYGESRGLRHLNINGTNYIAFATEAEAGVLKVLPYCEINFSDESHGMNYNKSAGVYYYNRSFGTEGIYSWNTSCSGESYVTRNSEIKNITVTAGSGLTECDTLDQANTIYTLMNNITTDTDCFIITANNITIDLNGHTIESCGEECGIGIYTKGYNSITIKNGSINSFHTGVYINDSLNNTLIDLSLAGSYDNNLYFRYGLNYNLTDVMTTSSYGNNIQIFNINNSFFNNLVADSSSDYSGISIGSSFNNTFTDIVANSNYDSNIHLSSSINNIFNNVFVSLSIGYSGIFVHSSSSNIFTNITANSNYEANVHLLISNNNTFNNLSASINENYEGILLTNSSSNSFINSVATSNYGGDIKLITDAINNSLINSSYGSEDVASGSQLIRKWYYTAYVNDTNGNNVAGANITAYNSTSAYQFNLTTGEDGVTSSTAEIIDYVNNGGTKTYYSPYNIFALNSSYATLNQSWNVSAKNNTRQNFTLGNFIGAINITYPANTTYFNYVTALNYTIVNGAYCWYSIDNGVTNSSSVSAGINWTNLNAVSNKGSNTWRLYCNDSSGNMNSTSRTFYIDDTNPEIIINKPENGVSFNNLSQIVNITSSEASSIFYDKDLELWWRMDDVNSSGDVVDYMGRNNGTAVGNAVQTDSGYFGKAFEFDGDGDYV
ncbi:MAG: hypothetical protein WCX73_02020, partial [Candidatus Pacearchaeota archaeon]